MDTAALVRQVHDSNRQAADAAARWATHRARVMDVLGQVRAAGGRLALLGAGHLHDVRLAQLVDEYAEVALVDLDPGPVHAAIARVPGAHSRTRIHAPLDLTGALHLLAAAAQGPHGVADVLTHLGTHACDIPGAPFDVTVSLGVLTQLLQAVTDAGVAAAEVPRVSLAIRDKHLRDLVRITRPGGTLVVVTDIVASTSAPGLLELPDSALEPHLARLVADGNFFTGTNPYRVMAVLEEDPPFRDDIAQARFVGPWWWRVTADRAHLTGAIVAKRHRR